MVGKYQLNFLEEKDLRDAFSKQQKAVQYKMNYLSCSILFILQVILFIRLQVFDRNGFHIVAVSTFVSIIALVLNHHATRFATILIFVQYILLNAQFTTDIYQKYIFQLVSNKPEMFLIGLGYGSLNLFIIQTFQKWYVRSACMWISCVLAFVWSDTNFANKLSYLLILYITTIFGIIIFYVWEHFEKENFSIIFMQNRSLSDWQKIIKENIPQSMVFVTRPKDKSTSNASSQIKKDQNDNQSSTKIELSNQMREKSDSKNSTQNNELVFNFVNKQFYDQFKIKDWVEKQQQQPIVNQGHNNPQQPLSRFALAEVQNKNQTERRSSNLMSSESRIHQILFNSIFKNILVSPSEGGHSFNDFDSSVENTNKTADTVQSLSEFLKSFIDEQRNQCDPNYLSEENNQGSNQNSQNINRRESFSYPDPVKGLNCFYRPCPPSYVLGDEQILEEQNSKQEQSTKTKGKQKLPSSQSKSIKTGALSAAETTESKVNRKLFTDNFITVTETDNLVGQNTSNERLDYYDLFINSVLQILLELEIEKEGQQKDQILLTQEFVSPRIIDHLQRRAVKKSLIDFDNDSEINTQEKLDQKEDSNVKKADGLIGLGGQESGNSLSTKQKSKESAKQLINDQTQKRLSKQDPKIKESVFVKTNQIQIEIPPANRCPQDTLIEIEDDEYDSQEMNGKPIEILDNQNNQQVTPNQRENNVDTSLRGKVENNANKNAGKSDQSSQRASKSNALERKTNGKDKLNSPQSNFLKRLHTGLDDNYLAGSLEMTKKDNLMLEGRTPGNAGGTPAVMNNSQNIISFEKRNDSNHQREEQFKSKDDESNQAFFFDTKMVSCLWGDEEGVLLILNDVSLKIINEKLRELERFKDKMLSTVTHDLKTPLNSIIMIMENSFEQKGGLGKKQRKIILQNSQMLMSLINDILDYQQIRRDKFRLIIEQIFISKCVLDVVDLFEFQAKQKRVKISAKFVHLQQEYMMNDERRIKQILVNLIGNAFKFTQQEGSIEVIVKQKQPDCIQIAIKDTGTGISEEIQKKLFQFFNTFDHSDKANNRHGIGLGLAICKQLNSQLGPWHEIKLKSQVDKGSKFTFCLYVNLLNHEGIEAPMQPAHAPQKAVLERQMSVRLGPLDSCRLELLSNSTRRFQLHRSATENTEGKIKQNQTNGIIKQSNDQANSDYITGNSFQNIGQTNNLSFAKTLAKKVATPPKQYSLKCSFTHEGDQASSKHISQQIGSQTQLGTQLKISEMHHLASPLASPNELKPSRELQTQYAKTGLKKKDSLKPTYGGLNSIPSIQSSGFLKLQESNYNLCLKSRGNHKEIHPKNKGIRSSNSRAVTVKIQIPERLKKSGLLKAYTQDENKHQISSNNSLIVPFYSPSAPIPSKNKTHSQEMRNPTETMTSLFANKLQEGTVSSIFGLKSKGIGPQQADKRRDSITTSKGKYVSKTSLKSNFGAKLGLQNSSNFMESVALGDDVFFPGPNKKQGKLAQQNDQTQLEVVEERVKAQPLTNMMTTDDNSEERVSENFNQIEELQNKLKAIREQALPLNAGKDISSILNSVQIPNENINVKTYNTEKIQTSPGTINEPKNRLFQKKNTISIHYCQSINNSPSINPVKDTEGPVINSFNRAPLSNNSHTNLEQDLRSIQENEKQEINAESDKINELNIQKSSENDDNDEDYEDVEEQDEVEGEQQGYIPKTLKKKRHIFTSLGKSRRLVMSKQLNSRDEEEVNDGRQGRDGGNNKEQESEDDDDDDEDEDGDEEGKRQAAAAKNQGINERRQQSDMLISLLQDYRCVLIADDSPFNIFCLQQVLGKNTELKINVAYNGNEALNSYKQNREQIIFMDLNMPILDGYECMKCIRQFEEDMEIVEKTKIIIISAQEYEPFFCNFDGVLSKPLKLLDIINLLALFRANDHNNTNNISVNNSNQQQQGISLFHP